MVWYKPLTWGDKPVKQEGTIYLKKSEEPQAKTIAKKTGASISIPTTKTTTTTTSGGGGSSSTKDQTIEVLKGGGIKVGGVTSYGKALVGDTRKTANQIQQETFEEARRQGITKRGTYSATITQQLPPKVTTKQTTTTTAKPSMAVQEAPTKTQQFKTSIQQQGYIKGSLFFAGQKASGWFSSSKFSPVKDSGYQAPVGKLSSAVVSVGPYFTSAGPALLFAGGAESYVTPSGRTRMKERESYLTTEKGFGPITSKVVSYGQPVAEMGLGFFGVRSQFKGIKATQEAKLFEKAPQKIKVARVEGETGGVDIGVGYKVTKPNVYQKTILRIKPTEYLIKYKQPFYKVGKGEKVVMESGEGITYSLSGKKLTATTFESSGVSYGGKNVMLGANKLKVGVKGLEGGYGKTIIQTKLRTTGKIKKAYDPLINDFRISYKAKVKPFIEKLREPSQFVSTQKDNLIKFAGGPTKKLRFYGGGRITSLSNFRTFGTIKRIKVPSSSGVESIAGTGLKQIPKTSFVSTDFSSAMKAGAITKQSIIPKTSFGFSKMIQPQKTKSIMKPMVAKTELKQVQVQKVESNQIIKPAQITIQKFKLATKKRTATKFAQAPVSIMNLAQVPKTRQGIIPSLKTPQLLKTTSRTPTPTSIITQPIVPITPAIIPFALPPVFRGERVGFGGDIKSRRTYSYTPSFSALAFGIKGKGYAPAPTTKFTGLELRPIYSKKKKKGLFNLFKRRF